MQPDRRKVLRDALFKTIDTVRMEWDLTFKEILDALAVTHTAIELQIKRDGKDIHERA